MAAEKLAERKCKPCEEGAPPLEGRELEALAGLVPEWDVVDEHHLERTFDFDDFKGALDWVNEVGALAEEQGHHPIFHFTYGEVSLEVYTHKVDGLVENDFILAAKIDKLWEKRQ